MRRRYWIGIVVGTLVIASMLVMLLIGSAKTVVAPVLIGTVDSSEISINLLWTVGEKSSMTVICYNKGINGVLSQMDCIVISKAWSEVR